MGDEEAKKSAATEAVNTCIRSGMRVGLGTGSTASWAVRRLAERINEGQLKDITCASTSEETRRLAESLGIKVLPLDGIKLPLDVTIDGADEILSEGKRLVLIKGRGGALLREKMVEVNSRSFVCVADYRKVVEPNTFGTTGAVPVEVVQFGAATTRLAVLSAVVSVLRNAPFVHEEAAEVERAAAELGVSAAYRREAGSSEKLFISDNSNFCLDLYFKNPIPDAEKMHKGIINVVGVVETGFFLGLTRLCIIGHPSGAGPTRISV